MIGRIDLLPEAVALRPVRMDEKNNRFIYYEGTTFPKNPRQGCELYLRRCEAFGYLGNDGSKLTVDVLDENADIIQEFPITKRGFEYLRRQFRFRREEVEQ